MINIKKYISLSALLLGASTLVNAEVIPVYQIDDAPGTYVQTTLTHDIYRYTADSQLNDLVVVDQQGNKLLEAQFADADDCRYFSFTLDGVLRHTRMNHEAIDFFKSLEEGKNYY